MKLIDLHIFLILCTLSGCDAIRIAVARDHEPKIETKESIHRFARKKRIDSYPILSLDTAFYKTFYKLAATPLFFNQNGEYVDLQSDDQVCIDKSYWYYAIRYVLEHGEDTFLKDSLTTIYYTASDREAIETLETNKGRLKEQNGWTKHEETYSPHLRNFSPYLIALNGQRVDVQDLYTDYLLLEKFWISGRSSLECILIREQMRNVKKLNKEFGDKIQIVLINLDEIERKG